ncbi:MAG: DNA-directed RNA polymerase subunit beta' [Caldilineaceae bacterium SB0665_bin_21]|nr:DNA-directed RNA polymerase subunit beta' [Caldilineaceae bacterium SB0665_bin_21]MYC63756.1 DNA-directed RNA polymerase subunit beta' [Caldilineaceae bacterium SB0661_bin_34]
MDTGKFGLARISLASPEQILQWSKGEVLKPETINYRTLKPERDGLFSERIFGPEKDWECSCGKYKRERYKGIICDKCGVEVLPNRVRRERMGHISLASPVSHIWYAKGMPCRLGLLLDISPRELEKVLYYAQYITIRVNEDARKRLIVRREKELALKLTKIQASTQNQRNKAEAAFEEARDRVLVERDRQIEDVDEDISTRSSSAIAEVQALIQWANEHVGKSAPESQRLSWVKRVVVAKGRRVAADLETVINGHFEDFADQLGRESEEKKAEIVQDAAAQVDDLREQVEQELAELDATEEQSREKLIETMEESLKGLKEIHTGMLISDHEYRNMVKQYGNTFEARMGAEGILELLRKIDLDDLIDEMREIIRTSRSEQKRTKAAKRLRVFVDLKKSGNRPEWMILTELPVIPPELRPMVQLDGGRFATSDLNDLYRRVINRNNRLKRLLELNAPDVIVRNEKRMLQEAVDSLIDNRKRNRNTANRNQRHPLKSLTDMLKGKQGRFRRNLLGKRVDYSGRSVIVVGPDLKLQQAGIPKSMALELFKPFVIENLVRNGTATNVRHAKRMVDTAEEEVWDVLEKITRERPVLLNRAPTLHRLGIQAFEVKLIEGSAIQLHPLVCTAFNADFDGDQMAVHVPLSDQAVREARELMLASRNLLKPSSGEPIISPTKDMVMGVFYLTLMEASDLPDAKLRHYPNVDQAVYAHEQGKVGLREPVMVRLRPYVEQQKVTDLDINPRWVKALEADGLETVAQLRSAIADAGSPEEFQDRVHDFGEVAMAETIEALAAAAEDEKPVEPPEFKRTTVGRIIFNRVLPPQMPFVNERLDKAGVSEVVHYAYQFLGMEETAEVADRIKALGFRYATLSGITMAVSDLEVPADKGDIILEAQQQELQLEAQYNRGLMTNSEMERGRIEAWNGATNQVSTRIRESLDATNSVGAMSISGAAKGGHTTINQLAGMRGLMYDPNGRIIPMPIRSNFRDGLTTMEYFISTHGSRKGLADTALRTADAGYLTRRLVDVAQDVIISHEDCGTPNGIVLDVHADKAHRTLSDLEGPREIWLGPQVEKILARCLAQNVVDPTTGEVLFHRNHLITDVEVSTLVERGIEQIEVRTPLTCDSRFGLCRYCYGSNLASREMVELGDAVGIIAAQSIGEPGTQLTLRTFHSGGVASSQDITRGLPRVEELFEARIPKGEAVISELDGTILTYFDGDVRMVKVSREDELHRPVSVPPEGWNILIAIGDSVQADMPIAMAKEAAELPHPPDSHMIRAGMEGTVDQIEAVGDGGTIHVRRTVPHTWEAEIPAYTEPLVKDGDYVTAGTQLTPGALDPKRILEISGREACQLYIRDEVQKVYVEQGVAIHDKHIEVILRQLLRRVQVQATGDTEFLLGEYVDRYRFEDVNDRMVDEGLKPAQGALKLLGMTRAALMTDSFLAAASFQETTRVLTDAAIKGQEDRLRGLKENVILGNLIPVGTGFHQRLTEEARIGAGSRDTEVDKGLGDMASDLEFLQELEDSDDILGAALAVGELDSLQNVGLGDDADDLEEEEEAVEPE